MSSYESYVHGKNAEQILNSGSTAKSNIAPYLQAAAQIRSNQELIEALKTASRDSGKAATKIVWLTCVLAFAAILQAIATGWPYIAWWIKSRFSP